MLLCRALKCSGWTCLRETPAEPIPHTFDAAGDVEETLVVHAAQVPRVQPAFLVDGLHGVFPPLQVAHEDMPAPDADLPNAVAVLLVQHVFTPTYDFATAASEWEGEPSLRETGYLPHTGPPPSVAQVPDTLPSRPRAGLLLSPSAGPEGCKVVFAKRGEGECSIRRVKFPNTWRTGTQSRAVGFNLHINGRRTKCFWFKNSNKTASSLRKQMYRPARNDQDNQTESLQRLKLLP